MSLIEERATEDRSRDQADGEYDEGPRTLDQSDWKVDGSSRSRDHKDGKDGGWAWVICGAMFFIILLSLGYVRIFGILYVAFQREFSSSASVTASIMGIYAMVYSVTSLLACNVFLERFSERQITLAGGILVAVGVALDFFANSISFLMCTNGIIVGIGNAMIFGPGIVILGRYFDARRTLATAIAFCGASVGGMSLPPLVRFILDEYGVRGAMLIFGAVLLHLVPAAILLVPPKMDITNEIPEDDRNQMLKEDGSMSDQSGDMKMNNQYTEVRNRHQNRLSCSLCDIPIVISATSPYEKGKSTYDSYVNGTETLFKSLPSDLNQRCNTGNDDFIHIYKPHSDEDNSDDSEPKMSRKQRIFSKIETAMDMALFKSPLFCAFIGFHFFGYAGITTFPIFVPPIAKENGLTDVQGALLVSLHAGLDLFCRIASGLIADLGWCKRYKMLATVYIILGTVYQFVRYYNTFPLMILYVVMFGMFSGCFYSLHPAIAVDFFGREKFPKVFGYVQFFHGVVITASYPIIGALRDFTGTYAASCHFLGISFYVAAGLLLFKPLIRNSHS